MTIASDRSKTNATNQLMTLEEYLVYSEDKETRYELVDGVLVEMGAETDRNNLIGMLLISVFLQYIPYSLLRRGTEIEVDSPWVTVRCPDLMVLTEATHDAMQRNQRSLILRSMPAPVLVIEVVSPGKEGSENYDRDYVEKRREYAARGIPEYWIVDPDRQIVLVLTLVGKTYQEHRFTREATIVSPTFPELHLTAAQILTAGQ